MDKAGGLTFYSSSQSSPLLFWAFSAACLTTFQIVNLPRFKRDDTLHPERRDSRTTWHVPSPPPPSSRTDFFLGALSGL